MARYRHASPPVEGGLDPLAPTHLTKQEFGRRLSYLLSKKNWTQSDLARAVFGTTEDAQGRTAAKGRDSISSYVRGQSYPSPRTVERLAQALEVDIVELLPNTVESALDAEHPAYEARMSDSDPGTMWVRLNMRLPAEDAVEIGKIITRSKKQAS